MINLTLHGIGEPQRRLEPDEQKVWLSISAFESLLDEICERPDVALTIDDGNCSDVEIVLPALLKRGMQASFFVLTGRFGFCGYLTQSDVKNIAEAGMIVGSHGMYHRDWRQLDDEELAKEIYISKEILEGIVGNFVIDAACPFGSYDHRVLRWLRKAGFQRVYTSDGGLARCGAWLQPRNTLRSSDTPESIRSIINQPVFSTKLLVKEIIRLVKRLR